MSADLTKGDIQVTILKAALPTVVAFLLYSAFNIADAIFVGWISAQALAAVSISFPIMFVIISLGTGIGVGATSVVARYIGAGKKQKANQAARHAMALAIAAGATLMIAGYIISPTLFDLMGVEPQLKQMALTYLNILLLFAPPMMILMVGNSLFRAEGDMRRAMNVMGAAAILNIILDPIFIFTLDMGIQGAAWATVTARTIGLMILLERFARGASSLNLNPKKFRYNTDYIQKILTVGIPSSLSNVIMSIGMFMFTAYVATYGTKAIAAFGIGFRLDSIALLPSIGFSVAVISVVGQNIGAKKVQRAKKATMTAGMMANCFMAALGAAFVYFSHPIASVFNQDPQVIEYTVGFLKTVTMSYYIVGITMAISGAFLGAGKAIHSLSINTARVIVFSVPLAYLMSQKMGLEGIWAGITLGSWLAFAYALWLYKKFNWNQYTH